MYTFFLSETRKINPPTAILLPQWRLYRTAIFQKHSDCVLSIFWVGKQCEVGITRQTVIYNAVF